MDLQRSHPTRGFRQLMTGRMENWDGAPVGSGGQLEVRRVEAAVAATVALQVAQLVCRAALTGCSTEVLWLLESSSLFPYACRKTQLWSSSKRPNSCDHAGYFAGWGGLDPGPARSTSHGTARKQTVHPRHENTDECAGGPPGNRWRVGSELTSWAAARYN